MTARLRAEWGPLGRWVFPRGRSSPHLRGKQEAGGWERLKGAEPGRKWDPQRSSGARGVEGTSSTAFAASLQPLPVPLTPSPLPRHLRPSLNGLSRHMRVLQAHPIPSRGVPPLPASQAALGGAKARQVWFSSLHPSALPALAGERRGQWGKGVTRCPAAWPGAPRFAHKESQLPDQPLLPGTGSLCPLLGAQQAGLDQTPPSFYHVLQGHENV